MAWFYFTGKKVDEESGLVFFGGRYYVPKIARWLTADPTIAHPYDPQDLNRYSYCRNNPVNLVDPTGYSWKSFFKAITDTQKYILDPRKSNPMIHGVTTGDWSYAKDMAIAGATGFLFGGPMGAATAMATTAFMRTPIAQWAVENYARYYYDNVMGMRPSTAYTWSYVTISSAASLSFERGFANMTAETGMVENFDMNNPEHRALLENKGNGFDTYSAETYTNPAKDAGWVARETSHLKVIKGSNGRLALVGDQRYILGAVHTGATSPNFLSTVNTPQPSFIPYSKLTTFGSCHQATNATLLKSGFSNVVTGTSGNYSTYITTAVYGNYGGGLVQKALYAHQSQSDQK